MLNTRLLQATVELGTAIRNWKRVEKECAKDRRPCPTHLYERHMTQIRLYRANLDQAQAAAQAMQQFPCQQ